MSLDSLTPLILEYRYWILIPLSILEGPIVAFIAGTLASLGYFNVAALALFFLVRDVAMDGMYYSLGYFGKRLTIVQRTITRLGVREKHFEEVRVLWEHHAGKTMFLGKLSYGIAFSFIILAGFIRMSLRKFFFWGAVVAIVQYWTLLALGYVLGTSLAGVGAHVIQYFSYVVAAATIIASLYYVFGKRGRKKLLKDAGEGA
ncbi:hypothetical protein HY418_02935 [Candidatus Kaiserbacteria bacterium]|nr:hypothetical protein [Candidatus Kaiserbacteria bacterium]